MSGVKESLLEDIAIFDAILKEEMKNVEGRQTMQSQVVTQKATPPAIVRFINHKLENQGARNGKSRSQSSNNKKDAE